ncbi:hypothetical protein BDDG_04776 [Blastomyces dermatitidis ATCC 18188]|uniref:Uncharacterized protein n=1 Tax=Ajellomyces dermatitidis (strain ATCC 18188 / CBS 674.68) TaxID=653446 RepID=F2TF20_AJEDA|nr:hypothetical protein BDDG_04776 [Blastomyces dermatitidis ATCC 18188]
MKFFSLFVALLGFLPFLAAAFPVADPVAEPEMHLEKRRSAQTCRIVNLRKGEYVNCRYGPTTKAGNIFAFRQGQKRTFSCKKKGQCIKAPGIESPCTELRVMSVDITRIVVAPANDSRNVRSYFRMFD